MGKSRSSVVITVRGGNPSDIHTSKKNEYWLKINALANRHTLKHSLTLKKTIKVSQKHTYTTSDYMEWSTMLNLVRRLYRDGYFRISLLVGCGCFFGLRISDLLSLTWEMLLEGDSFMIQEKKTGKRRIIRINPNFRLHIEDCFNALDVRDKSENAFYQRRRWSIQYSESMSFWRRFGSDITWRLSISVPILSVRPLADRS